MARVSDKNGIKRDTQLGKSQLTKYDAVLSRCYTSLFYVAWHPRRRNKIMARSHCSSSDFLYFQRFIFIAVDISDGVPDRSCGGLRFRDTERPFFVSAPGFLFKTT